jgi:hypothetical protein
MVGMVVFSAMSALPWVDKSKATIKVKGDNCELRVKIKII